MNISQYFSFSRFTLVVKRDFMENWKYNLRVFLLIFLVCMFVYFSAMCNYTRTFGSPQAYIAFHAMIISSFYSFMLFVQASQFMIHMRTKEARISNLMLPATSLEKFISRSLFVTLGLMIMFIVALFLADVIHLAFIPFFPDLPDELNTLLLPQYWENSIEYKIPEVSIDSMALKKVGVFPVLLGVGTMILASCLHAIYILGGNLFGKNAFLITTIFVFLVGYVGIRICDIIVPMVSVEWCEDFIRSNGEGHLGWGRLFVWCFNAFIWYVSFLIFSRQQVVKSKFRLW